MLVVYPEGTRRVTDLRVTIAKNPRVVASALLLAILVVLYWQTRPERHAVPPDMSVTEKKARFRDLLLPVIEKVHADLESDYLSAEQAVADGTNFAAMREEYRATTDKKLLAALKPHPISIVLAQAAMESAWATSRFFVEANNIFGVWSFDPDEPRIAAGEKRGDKTVYLKKYGTLEAAIRDYYLILARGENFSEFRALRLTSDDPFKLVAKLDKYSEKGALYGEELVGIIRYNEFQQYD